MMRTRFLVPVTLTFFAALSIAGLWMDLLVVRIDSPEVAVAVSEGDILYRTYMHSMYEVPVSEKFRIEGGHFRLVHVHTQSEAVLAYLGIEGKDEPNAHGEFREFSIPAASIGDHRLRLHDCDIPLGTHECRDGNIHVQLARVSLIDFALLVWR
jgi:hypothetical protein